MLQLYADLHDRLSVVLKDDACEMPPEDRKWLSDRLSDLSHEWFTLHRLEGRVIA